MTRGRKPKAGAARRGGETEALVPVVKAAAPAPLAPPASVMAHEGMRELWSSLVGTGIAYDERDVPTIEQLVFDFEMVEQCRAHVMREDGTMAIMVPAGEPDPETGEYLKHVPNPYIRQMRDATAEALKLADQLGLTPLARARLGLTQAAGRAVTLSIAEQIDAAMARRR